MFGRTRACRWHAQMRLGGCIGPHRGHAAAAAQRPHAAARRALLCCAPRLLPQLRSRSLDTTHIPRSSAFSRSSARPQGSVVSASPPSPLRGPAPASSPRPPHGSQGPSRAATRLATAMAARLTLLVLAALLGAAAAVSPGGRRAFGVLVPRQPAAAPPCLTSCCVLIRSEGGPPGPGPRQHRSPSVTSRRPPTAPRLSLFHLQAPACRTYVSKGLIQPATGSLQDVIVVQAR